MPYPKAVDIKITPISGLIYTIPAALKITVTAPTIAKATQVIFEGNLDFAQYGNIGIAPVASKLFSSRKTNIEFSPTTGALITYKTENGSSSENLGKSFENSSKLLQSTLFDINYNTKIETLKKQKELLDANNALIVKPESKVDTLNNSIELLKLQIELKKLQIAIDSLGKN